MSMLNVLRFVLALLVTGSVAGGLATGATTETPKGQHDLPTTSETIYLRNLGVRFDAARRHAAEHPHDVAGHKALSRLHALRGHYEADPDQTQLAIEAADTCLALAPEDADCLLLRSRQWLALHSFGAASADLARAETLAADPFAVADLRQEIDWEEGRRREAAAAIRQAAASRPVPRTLARLARLEQDLGNHEAAAAAFQTAEDAVVDVDPLTVAWLNVQRGVRHLELGDPLTALTFYEEAARRMPGYVLAGEHMAEALTLTGDIDGAIALYEEIVARTPHALSLVQLARLHRQRGNATRAAFFERRAIARLGALKRDYPVLLRSHEDELRLTASE